MERNTTKPDRTQVVTPEPTLSLSCGPNRENPEELWLGILVKLFTSSAEYVVSEAGNCCHFTTLSQD